MSISPPQSAIDDVYSQSVGPAKLIGDHFGSIDSIHPYASNIRRNSPICPVGITKNTQNSSNNFIWYQNRDMMSFNI